jgi:hypothetical protein
MKQIVLYQTFAFNRRTCQFDIWMGTASAETIRKHGLGADLGFPLYCDEKVCIGGWGFKSPLNRYQ